MKKQFLAIFIALFAVAAYGQKTEFEVREMVKTASEQELVVECSSLMQENFLYYAEIVVDKLLEKNPTSCNYNYRKGYLLLYGQSQPEKAIAHLVLGSAIISKNYDMYSSKEKGAPADIFFHLGKAYHLNEEVAKAKDNYLKFIEKTRKKSELIPTAQLNIAQCDIATNLMANPKKVEINNIGARINSIYPEYAPAISLDGSALYFTSRRQWEDKSTDEYRDMQKFQHPEDIYLSLRDNETENFGRPKRLEFCEGKSNEASISVSSDERKIYTYNDQDGNGDIYFSDFKRNVFTEQQHLDDSKINTKYWETHVTVAPDGQSMYFVSDRLGGFGKRDIYRVIKLPSGGWSDPINLGPEINTAEDEDSPFLAVDNKTMYFASNGKSSMGDFDIFISVRDTNNVWSNAINMGYPFNSTGDDIFYTTTSDGLLGYFTSFRKGTYGEKDIYQIKNDYLGVENVAVLKGSIRMSDGTRIPEDTYMTLRCTDCANSYEIALFPRIRDGHFFSSLEKCHSYELKLYADSTSDYYTDVFSTQCDKKYEEVEKNYILDVNRNTIVPDVQYSLAGIVADRKTAELLANSTVEFIDPSSGKTIEKLISSADGSFTSSILLNKTFGEKINLEVKVAKEEYITQTFSFNMTLGKELKINLKYLIEKDQIGTNVGELVAIQPIYFDLNKSDIRPDAKIELDKIVKIMNDNPNMKIELSSHTDCRNTIAYNLALSSRRAKSSAAYIKARISTPTRIYGKGYGESKLVNDCGCEGKVVSSCSEEEHQANRRTEFMIVK
ncbi:MAG: OmpA family protein [Bacteroidota bacterium]